MIVGIGLRLPRLSALPPWTDEIATLVFSLGNKFAPVPVNELIDPATLLKPLQQRPEAGIADVVQNLLTESTHPPFYFILNHVWVQLFPATDGEVSLWGARLLAVLLGVAAIPALFSLGWFAFESVRVGHIAALLMAISPLGIFLAQKARHYTFLILLVTASFACFLIAVRQLQRRQPLRLALVLTWIVVNGCGAATHYFFPLTFLTQGLVLLKEAWREGHVTGIKSLLTKRWKRLYAVALGSLGTCLVWLPFLLHIRSNEATDWLFEVDSNLNFFLALSLPILRILLWTSSAFFVLPSQTYTLPLELVISIGIITFAVWGAWIIPITKAGLSQQQSSTLKILRDYVIAAMGLFLVITYGLGLDLTVVARYQFVYFPVFLLWLGVAFAGVWQQSQVKLFNHSISGKLAISIMVLLGCLGSISTITNQGFLQNHRPDLFANLIQASSPVPLALVAPYDYHSHKGRMMGLAWELRRRGIEKVQYGLVTPTGLSRMADQLTQLPRPVDIWLVNLPERVDWVRDCTLDSSYQGQIAESRYRLYRCRE